MDWNAELSQLESLKPRSVQPVKTPEPEPQESNISRGFKAGLYQTAAVAPAIVSMGGKLTGMDSVADWGAEKAGGLMDKAGEYQPDTSFSELWEDPSVDGALDWLFYTAGNLAPTMLVGAGGAGLGLKIGGKLVAKQAVKKALTKNAVKLMRKGVPKNMAAKVAAEKMGMKIGIVGAVAPMEAAHNYMTDVEQHGVEDASVGKAAVTGTAAGLAEIAFGGGHLRLINKVMGNKAGRIAQRALKAGEKTTPLRMLKEAVVQGGGEGLQELTQEELSILNEIWTGEDQSLFDKENLLRAAEAGAAGVVMGAPAGGLTGISKPNVQTPEQKPRVPENTSASENWRMEQAESDERGPRSVTRQDYTGLNKPDEYARMEASEGEARGDRTVGVRQPSVNPVEREIQRRREEGYWKEEETKIKAQRRDAGMDRKPEKQIELEEAWQRENATNPVEEQGSAAKESVTVEPKIPEAAKPKITPDEKVQAQAPEKTAEVKPDVDRAWRELAKKHGMKPDWEEINKTEAEIKKSKKTFEKKAPEAAEAVGRSDNVLDRRLYEVQFEKLEGRFKRDEHKQAVEQALKENKPVPQEVLADYPDLKAPPVVSTQGAEKNGIAEKNAQSRSESERAIQPWEKDRIKRAIRNVNVQDAHMDEFFKSEAPEGYPHRYYSPNRPVGFIRQDGIKPVDRFLYSDRELTPKEVAQWELVPVDGKTRAKLAIDTFRTEHGNKPVEFYRQGDGKIDGAVVTKSAKKPGMWQSTYFDQRGFSGDTQHKSEVEAVKDVLETGFSDFRPGILNQMSKRKEFREGNERVERMQKEHRARMRKINSEVDAESTGILTGKKNGKLMKPKPPKTNEKGLSYTVEEIHQLKIAGKDVSAMIKNYDGDFKKDYTAHIKGLYGDSKMGKSFLKNIGGASKPTKTSRVAAAIDNEVGSAQIINDIAEHAVKLYESGVKNAKSFSRAMQKKFIDVWDKLKKYISKIFSVLNNERGEIVIRQDGATPKVEETNPEQKEVSENKEPKETGMAYTKPTRIDDLKSTLTPYAREFIHWIVDKNHSIQVIQNRLGKISDEINVFLKETQRPKITAARIQQAWDDEIYPLLDKMAEYKKSEDELDLYAHAKHVIGDNLNQDLLERNAKLRVEEIIAALPQKDAANVSKGVEKLKTPQEWFKALEEILEAHGDKEAVQLLEKKWKKGGEWKPLSGMSDKEANEILKKGDSKLEELRRMLSSINDNRLDMVFNAGLLPEEEYKAIKKKYQYYVPLMREGYDDKLFGVPRGIKPSGKQVRVRGGSTKNVVNILANSIANYERSIGAAEKAVSQKALHGMIKANPDNDVITLTSIPKSKRFDSNGNLRMYPDMGDVQESQMRLMVDGKMYMVEVEKADRDAMLMMRTLKSSEHTTGPIVNFLAKINRILARINTTWSPEFIISNFIRDIQTAGINIQDTGVRGEKMLRGATQAWKAIWAVERGKRKGIDLEKLYDRFKKAGGKIGWSDVHGSVENLAKKIKREIDMRSGKAPTKAMIKQWFDLIEDANTAIENGVRLHAFKLATEQGKSDEIAAQIASDLTVDFTKKGAAGPVINSLYLFANAGIQGSYRIIRAATKSKKVQGTLAGIVGASFVVGLLNSMAGEDEDGEDYFNKIDDFVRERNMIFMLPGTKGKYVKIPAPWGYNLFWNIGTELSRAVTKENYSAMKGAGRLASVAANAFNPIASGTLLQTLSPTVTDPFVQVSENKNWFGGDLMPAKNKFEKIPTPDSQRYWASASVGSRWVTRTLNELTGGDKVKSGAIDISPETLDLIVDTAGGSALRFFKDTIGVPAKAVSGEEVEMHKIPFLRRVAGEQPEWADSRIYYSNVSDVLTMKEQLDAYKGTDYYETLIKSTKGKRRLIKFADSSERSLRRLRKRLRIARAKGNGEVEKKIETAMNKVYTDFNKRYNNY